MAGKPGLVVEQPWQNFAHNRNASLKLAQERGEYVFFIDADETLMLEGPIDTRGLDGDAYYMTCEYAGMRYGRVALVKGALPWRWNGVVHEFLECDQPYVHSTLHGPIIWVSHEGARSKDPATYLKDAALLEEALKTEPQNTRYWFYLAQSYRDAGKWHESRHTYKKRAQMAGYDEEIWYSKYQLGILNMRLEESPAVISQSFLEAFQTRPTRAEPLVALARFHRERAEYGLAAMYARHAMSIAKPADLLFIDAATYEWSALDEFSVAAYYVGPREEGIAATRRLLENPHLPTEMRPRVEQNLRWYLGTEG
jgi:hypothetical protein